jgi:iron complex transport system substrate-binding protein
MGETEVCGQPQKVAALTPHILDSILGSVDIANAAR